MPSETEIEATLWKHLKSDRTVMLGLADAPDEAQPMTALIEDEEAGGPLWIFTAKDTGLARSLEGPREAVAQFASKGHDLFATLRGTLTTDMDRAAIDRLWSPFIAAWFEGGKDDPKLLLLRFDPAHAQIWLNENSVFSGLKLLLGRDPKAEYAGKTADVAID